MSSSFKICCWPWFFFGAWCMPILMTYTTFDSTLFGDNNRMGYMKHACHDVPNIESNTELSCTPFLFQCSWTCSLNIAIGCPAAMSNSCQACKDGFTGIQGCPSLLTNDVPMCDIMSILNWRILCMSTPDFIPRQMDNKTFTCCKNIL